MSVQFVQTGGGFDFFSAGKKSKLTDERKEQLNNLVKDFCADYTKFKKEEEEFNSYEYTYMCEQFAETITSAPNLSELPNATRILWMLCLSYRIARYPYKVWDAAAPKFVQIDFSKLDPQGRLYAYDFLAAGTSSPDRFDVWPLFISKLDIETSDKIRACLILLLIRCFQYHYGNEEKMTTVKELCKDILVNNKYGPLTQFAAAILLAVRARDEPFVPAIKKLVEVLLDDVNYNKMWHQELDADWAFDWGSQWSNPNAFDTEDQEVELRWAARLPDILSNLDGSSIAEHVRPALLEALKNNIGRARPVLFNLLAVTFNERLPDETYFAELEPTQQKVVKALSEIPSLREESHNEILTAGFNLPADLTTFINTPIPMELLDTKRIACLEGLSKVKWSELNHAYGHASDLPDLIKALASRSEERRESAWNSMWCAPYHQGTRYPGTVAMISFIIQLLECKRVEDKGRMLEWLEHVACGWPSSYSIVAFDPKSFDEIHDNYNDDQTIRRQCFDEAEKGCPVYVSLALGDNPDVEPAVRAISMLSRFPSFKEKSIPALRDLYNNTTKPDVVRCSAIMAISHLVSNNPEEAEKLKKELLHKLTSTDLTNLDRPCTLLYMEDLALGRLYVQQKEQLPQIVKTIVFHHLENPDGDGESAFGKISKIVRDFLSVCGNQFTEEIITKLSSSTFVEPVLSALVSAVLSANFEEQNGFVSSDSKLPEFFKLKITDKQARVLQAIVDCDGVWNMQEREKKNIAFNLHTLLQLRHDPTRETLRVSLEKFREGRAKGEIDENGKYLTVENNAVNIKNVDMDEI